MPILRTVLPVLLSLALSFTAHAASADEGSPGGRAPAYGLKSGQPFPAFSLEDTAGKRVTRKSLSGRYTVVLFYFSDCPPCLDSLPVLAALPARYPGLRFLAMTPEPLTVARDIALQYSFGWTTLPEAGRIMRTIGVADYPSLAIIGPDGRLVAIDSSAHLQSTGEPIGAWIGRMTKRKR